MNTIVALTPNAALDRTWRVPRLETGESHRVGRGTSRAGGKGVNAARVVHALGLPSLAVVTAGGATGERLAAELDASGLPHRIVPVAGETRESIAIVDDTGRATLLNERGIPLRPAELDALATATREASQGAGALLVSGSLPPGTPVGFLAGVVRDAPAPVVVDTHGPALLEAARAGAEVLAPNRAELAETSGERGALAGARRLLDAGAALVVVSLGVEGMLAVPAHGEALAARPSRVLHGNPTGAGDAASAAIASWLAESRPGGIAGMLRRAVAWSAAAVPMPLAGEVDPELARRVDEVEVFAADDPAGDPGADARTDTDTDSGRP